MIERIKDKKTKMSNGKAFTVYVCYSNIQRSTYTDVNSHVLVDNKI